MKISQGTVSVLVGCHSVVHSILVIKAWKKLYAKWPEPWQLGCIFLHDVGHVGLDYLDSKEEKAHHWMLGSELARVIFGKKGYDLVAGHSKSSGEPQSELYKPDKYSWHLAPVWWLLWQSIVEPKLRGGKGHIEHITQFREWVTKNVEGAEWRETHEAVDDLKSAKSVNKEGHN